MEEVLHIVVGGRVQGVGFRYHAERVARRHGVAGWVRNLSSGDVEILARVGAGDKAAFLAALEQGPAGAHVSGMRIEAPPDAADCPKHGFTVRL